MRIAFVTYEYPPDTADGGIATYVRQASHMLSDRGHSVEVFAASRERDGLTWDGPHIRVYRVRVSNKQEFAALVAPTFTDRHRSNPFDVLEGPDFNADAAFCRVAAPYLPLVVRLHTPRYLATSLNTVPDSMPAGNEHGAIRARFGDGYSVGARVDWTTHIHPLPGYTYASDYEYLHLKDADLITSPSYAIRDIVCRDWHIDESTVEVVPNIFHAHPEYLEIPVHSITNSQVVTFLGRLEGRKGVLSLAAAIPMVLRRFPEARFRFVGRPLASPKPDVNMLDYLKQVLEACADRVQFVGPVPPEKVPSLLSETDLCVFPSRWENFPCVCLEAMSAARGIVGSMAGGMAEMLSEDTGLLTPPDDPEALADAIVILLENPARREQMGQAARQRVRREYDISAIAPQHENLYLLAIERAARRHK